MPTSYLGANEDGDSRGESLAQTITSTIVVGLVHTLAHWKVLLLGQSISVVLAIAGGTNEILSLECKVSAPSTYNALGYCVVGIFGGILLKVSERKEKLKKGGDEEEKKNFREVGGENKTADDEDDDEDDVEDDLTIEDEDSTSKRSFFSSKAKIRADEKSKESSRRSMRQQQQHSFLFGLFTIRAKWWYYFTVAFIEAQAYYFIFLAFRYTSFTFVYVSDALAIPAAMIFTKLIMKRSYLWTHLIGGAVCMAGIVVNTVADVNGHDGDDSAISSTDHIKGDLFAIFGAILLGLDDVLSEIIVTDYGGVTEMVFMKGVFGTLISVVQLLAFEMDSFQDLFGTNEGSPCDFSWRMALLSIHVATRAMDVAGEMQFLYLSEAALLNLSLLTSDLYAAIFDVLATGLHLSFHFFLAFFLIFAGIVLYEAGPSPALNHQSTSTTPLDIEFRQKKKKKSYVTNPGLTDTEHTSNVAITRELELT